MLVVESESISLLWELITLFMQIHREKIPCHVAANKKFSGPPFVSCVY